MVGRGEEGVQPHAIINDLLVRWGWGVGGLGNYFNRQAGQAGQLTPQRQITNVETV